jgi:uncharacterized protein YacL (UPF0231 family)
VEESLKQYIYLNGLNQRTVAKKINITHETLCRWLSTDIRESRAKLIVNAVDSILVERKVALKKILSGENL